MLAPDDTTKYESTLRRSSGISRYSYEKTTVPGNRSKRNYLKDERKEQIERENRALIKTMRQYDKYPVALYKGVNNLRYSHSLVMEARKKEIQKVEEENRKIYQRIIKTAATMNTRIFIKEYYKNHQFQYNGVPPLTNRPKTACLAFQTNGINSEIPMPRPKTASQPLDPIRRRAEIQRLKQDNQLVLNKSYDIVLFHGFQIVSNKTVMITLWELYKVTDKGRDGTNGIKIESKTNNRESGIILTINELIYICSFHPTLRKLMKELLILEEPDIYSSLYKVLGLPNDNSYAVELITFLCKFIKVEGDDDRNILEFTDRLKEMIEKCHNNEDPDEDGNVDDIFEEDYIDNDDEYDEDGNNRKRNDRSSLSLISNGSSTPPPLRSINNDNNIDEDDDILAKQMRMSKNTSVPSSNRSSSVKRYSDVKSKITTRRNDVFENDNIDNNNQRERRGGRRRVVTINYKNTPNYTRELTMKKFTHSPTNTTNTTNTDNTTNTNNTVKPIKRVSKPVGPPHCATVPTASIPINKPPDNKSDSPKHNKKRKSPGPPRCATIPLKKDTIIQEQQQQDKQNKVKKVNKKKSNSNKKERKRIDKEVESADILVLNRDDDNENNENNENENNENNENSNEKNENNDNTVNDSSIYILESISRDLDEDEEDSSLVNEMEMKIMNEIEQTVRMNQQSEEEEEEEEDDEEDSAN